MSKVNGYDTVLHRFSEVSTCHDFPVFTDDAADREMVPAVSPWSTHGNPTSSTSSEIFQLPFLLPNDPYYDPTVATIQRMWDSPKWVCLKIGYIPNYSHLIGIMIINHWI